MSEPALLPPDPRNMSLTDKIIYFCLNNKLVVALMVAFIVGSPTSARISRSYSPNGKAARPRILTTRSRTR